MTWVQISLVIHAYLITGIVLVIWFMGRGVNFNWSWKCVKEEFNDEPVMWTSAVLFWFPYLVILTIRIICEFIIEVILFRVSR